jgi:hypothetical protein
MKQLPQSASFRCSRRQAVQIGFGLFGFGLFGMGLDRFLQAASVGQTKDVSCIFLFLAGGPSQFETFDPKPHAPLEARGIWNPISTSVPGIQVCEKRPLLARRMDNLERFVSATGSGFESVDRFSAEATALLTTDAMRQAMNLEDEPEALRERSGQSGAVGDNVGRGHGRVWSDATNQPGPGARPLSRGWQRVVCRSGDESGCGDWSTRPHRFSTDHTCVDSGGRCSLHLSCPGNESSQDGLPSSHSSETDFNRSGHRRTVCLSGKPQIGSDGTVFLQEVRSVDPRQAVVSGGRNATPTLIRRRLYGCNKSG